jgi:hypothetical protein
MRKRLRRARYPDGVPLAPAECRRRSRAALERRVLCAVFLGDGLTTIARRPHMPRAATLDRWIARDAAFRNRYRKAREDSRYVLAGDMLALAREAWANARTTRQRMGALRMRLDLLKWWAKTFAETPGKSGAANGRPTPEEGETIVRLLNEALEKSRAEADTTTGDAAENAPFPASREDAPSAFLAPEERRCEDDVRPPAAAPPCPTDAPAPERPAGQPKQTPPQEPEPLFDRLGFPIRRDPPGTWMVRFDVDVPRPRDAGMSTYDPLR